MKLESSSWSLVWCKLREEGHRLIAFDLPGHGNSNLTQGALQLSSLLQDLERIIEHFDVQKGVLVGHGLGGFLALHYLAEYRKHAKRCAAGHRNTRHGYEMRDMGALKTYILSIQYRHIYIYTCRYLYYMVQAKQYHLCIGNWKKLSRLGSQGFPTASFVWPAAWAMCAP